MDKKAYEKLMEENEKLKEKIAHLKRQNNEMISAIEEIVADMDRVWGK